jgi:hypothetical protein
MANNKKIPTADLNALATRLSKPRNPEAVKLPEDISLITDDTAKGKTTTEVPKFVSQPAEEEVNRRSPQEQYDPSKLESLLNGSLTGSLTGNNLDSDRFDPDSRRRAPPPVSFNPLRFNKDNGQIPLSPGAVNLPKEWQDLPKNFQDQLRRLLPVYYDITGPNGNLIDRDEFIPPNLFDDGEPNPQTDDFLVDRSQYLDESQYEPPNKSKINFLNLLLFLFNLIFSLKAADIKGDNYEVVNFLKTSDDPQRAERTEPGWQATVREKIKEIDSEEGNIKLGGRTIGDFNVGDSFPVRGAEVTVQEIITEEEDTAGGVKQDVPIKIILSNGEEILKAVSNEQN